MINVIVADKSAIVRLNIKKLLEKENSINLVSLLNTGDQVIADVKIYNPDVLLLDAELLTSKGDVVLEKIMKDSPLPIIILSKNSDEGFREAMMAIELGAIDVVKKPDKLNVDLSLDIIQKIKAVSESKLKKFKKEKLVKHKFSSTRKKIIVIASSTGGPQTLESLLIQLPGNIPAPILIVQHMPAGFTKSFAERLNSICEVEVKEAEAGDEPRDGLVLIAPGGYHMELKSDNPNYIGEIMLHQEPPELGVRPCANKLFKSVAPIFQENTIGVVLTGMGRDGTDGSAKIKEYNGTIIVEAEESCIIYGMPKEVVNAGYADEILALENIPVALIQLLDI